MDLKTKYNLTEEDMSFIREMQECVKSQSGFLIESKYYGLSIDPIGEMIEAWNGGNMIGVYENIDTMLEKIIVNEKKLVELISDFDFA